MPSSLPAWLVEQHGCGIPSERLQSEDSKGDNGACKLLVERDINPKS